VRRLAVEWFRRHIDDRVVGESQAGRKSYVPSGRTVSNDEPVYGKWRHRGAGNADAHGRSKRAVRGDGPVHVSGRHFKVVTLEDEDPDLRDPGIDVANIPASNGIAQAIDHVQMPINV